MNAARACFWPFPLILFSDPAPIFEDFENAVAILPSIASTTADLVALSVAEACADTFVPARVMLAPWI